MEDLDALFAADTDSSSSLASDDYLHKYTEFGNEWLSSGREVRRGEGREGGRVDGRGGRLWMDEEIHHQVLSRLPRATLCFLTRSWH